MDPHSIFSDSGDEDTGSYHCSDPNHCDKGDECDGEHTYSLEYYRSLVGELSEDKSETVDGKPQPSSQPVVIKDCEGDEKSGDDKSDDDKSGDADPVNSGDNSREHNSDSGDDDHKSDSEDAQSCS